MAFFFSWISHGDSFGETLRGIMGLNILSEGAFLFLCTCVFTFIKQSMGWWDKMKSIIEEDGRKIKKICIEKKCSFSLDLLFKKSALKTFRGLMKAKNSLEKCEILHFYKLEIRYIYRSIASTAFLRTDASKKTRIYGKICIKACLEIEKTQAVCCSQPKNILFLLNWINLSLCYFFIVNMCVHKGVFLANFPLAMLHRCNMLTAFTT